MSLSIPPINTDMNLQTGSFADMFHKIDMAEVIDTHMIKVKFKDGSIKTYDAMDIAKNMDKDIFQNVHVDTGGYGLVWDDDTDVWCNEVYEYGK